MKKRKVTLKSTGDFYVVGMGASAGGLEAFERFFQHMPENPGMAFILVPHLDPTHASLMPSLLQKSSKMTVEQVKNGTRVKPNVIYVVPPNHNLAILKGTLQLMDPVLTSGQKMPIDFFLRSLALDKGNRAVCVILSGMGSDGTLGLRAIKGELGLAMVQSPDSAKYDSMPKSAIDTDLADFILPPESMPARLIAFAKYSHKTASFQVIPPEGKVPDAMKKIFVILRNATGHDFSSYKKNTVYRRIERRMNMHQIKNISTYVRFFQESPKEINSLFKEMLIGVTGFFRDSEAFEKLKRDIIPVLLDKKPVDYQIRVWVPGCSTGEEAYSVAICLREYIESAKLHCGVQVFATDIDSDAIDIARQGVYPASIATDVSKERLKRFFTAEEGTFRIRKEVRDMLVFATQSVIKDPPFTKMDIISCRNLLIYLDGTLQKRVIPLFHYSLRRGGILFLGTSESVGGFTDLFVTIEKKWKIFRRTDESSRLSIGLEFPVSADLHSNGEVWKKTPEPSTAHLAERMLLASYAPPGVVANMAGDILYIHGKTGRFLEPAPGEAKWNIHEMGREGLKPEIAAAIRRMKTSRMSVVLKGLKVRYNGGFITVDVTVLPMLRGENAPELLLIVFEEKATVALARSTDKTGFRVRNNNKVIDLEKELLITRENLHTTIEELETANEELKSTNEELQSTNEELETTKEEQQSLNEELTTVNSELQGKIDELIVSNNDMKNLLNSTSIPTIFLDMDLRIKRYTPHATRVINLIQSDIGRPVGDLVTKIHYNSFIDDARAVLSDLVFREREVESLSGEWYMMKILPYRTVNNVIDGVVITFQDTTESKLAREEISYYRSFPELDPDPVAEIDLSEGEITYANPAARKTLRLLSGGPEERDVAAALAGAARRAVAAGKETDETTLPLIDSQFRIRIALVPERNRARMYLHDLAAGAEEEKGPS